MAEIKILLCILLKSSGPSGENFPNFMTTPTEFADKPAIEPIKDVLVKF